MITFRNYQANVKFDNYSSDDSICIRLETLEEEPLATATICLVQYGLTPPEGHCFIKNYAENEGLLEVLTEAKVIEPTGVVITFGEFDTRVYVAKVL